MLFTTVLYLVSTIFAFSDSIINGIKSSSKEFPFAVNIKEFSKRHKNGTTFCTGVIINKFWILTAAHCFDHDQRRDTDHSFVVAGDNDLSSDDGTEVLNYMELWEMHPSYDPYEYIQNKTPSFFDLALVKMLHPFNFTDNIKPVLFNLAGEILPPDIITIAGWGKETVQDGKYPNFLQKLDLKTMINKECVEYHDLEYSNNVDNFLCAYSVKDGACPYIADSGSGAVSRCGSQNYLRGILAFYGNCSWHSPIGFISMTDNNIKWIQNKTGEIFMCPDPAETGHFAGQANDIDIISSHGKKSQHMLWIGYLIIANFMLSTTKVRIHRFFMILQQMCDIFLISHVSVDV